MNEQNDIIINSKYYIGLSYKDHFLLTGLKLGHKILTFSRNYPSLRYVIAIC